MAAGTDVSRRVRLNMVNTPADGLERLEANLLEMLGSQYTLWNRRGIDVGLESVDESGVVRFPPPARQSARPNA